MTMVHHDHARTAISGAKRRNDAALRLQPLPCGYRDPDDPRRTPPPMPRADIALHIIFIGGHVTADEARAVWNTYPKYRSLIEAYAAAHSIRWGHTTHPSLRDIFTTEAAA